jgi:hypothetical protein
MAGILLIGGIYSDNDLKVSLDAYDRLTQLNIPIFRHHNYFHVNLLQEIKNQMKFMIGYKRILIMHYHDEIKDYNKIKEYINDSSNTFMASPTIIYNHGKKQTITEDLYCLSGLIINTDLLQEHLQKEDNYYIIVLENIYKQAKIDKYITCQFWDKHERDEDKEFQLSLGKLLLLDDKKKKADELLQINDLLITEQLVEFNLNFYASKEYVDDEIIKSREELINSIKEYRKKIKEYFKIAS